LALQWNLTHAKNISEDFCLEADVGKPFPERIIVSGPTTQVPTKGAGKR